MHQRTPKTHFTGLSRVSCSPGRGTSVVDLDLRVLGPAGNRRLLQLLGLREHGPVEDERRVMVPRGVRGSSRRAVLG